MGFRLALFNQDFQVRKEYNYKYYILYELESFYWFFLKMKKSFLIVNVFLICVASLSNKTYAVNYYVDPSSTKNISNGSNTTNISAP